MRSIIARRVCGALAALVLLTIAAGAAEPQPSTDWPRFRGLALDGHSAESGLLRQWPEGGPKVLWRAPVGAGFSGISVVGDRLYTMFDRAGDELLVAFDAASGAELWSVRIDGAYSDDQGGGPRATPALDGGRVFALSAQGKLHVVAATDGKRIWSHDLVAEYGARVPQWGVSTQPLVDGELLIVNAGGKDGKSILAFDKASGTLRWSSGDDEAGYASPLPIEVEGVPQVLVFAAKALVAVSPQDGRELWRVSWRTDWDVNAAAPIFAPPNRVIVASGYHTGAALLQVRRKGTGWDVETTWSSRGFKNQFSTSVAVKGKLYGFDNSVLKCLDLNTGEEHWKASGLGHGSLLYADGLLIVLSERGALVLVEATPDEYRERSRAQVLEGKCWTVPTLAGGRLYVRNEKELKCLQVK